ncbi:hypothetical protein RSAG8_11454, partial [Rhizoctonia solani AG-8 WAC10335]
MPSWFRREETDWCLTTQLDAFNSFDRQEDVEYKGKVMSLMSAWKLQIVEAFAERFPYRHLDTDRSKIPKELRKFQASRTDWDELGERFRNRFNYFNRIGADPNAAGEEEEEREEEEEEREEEEEEEEEEEVTNKAGTTSGQVVFAGR